MNLIILTERDRIDQQRFAVSDYRAEHLGSILKVEKGDRVEVGFLNGPKGLATVEPENERFVLCVGQWQEMPARTPEIDIICALPRPQTLKKVLLTSAMMGVRALYLIRANRVEKSYFQSPLVEPENQLPYLIEGLSQGKLTRLPKVSLHDRFKAFFEDTVPALCRDDDGTTVRLLADPATSAGLNDALDADAREIVLAIGPEGGWVPFEIELMEKSGFKAVRLSHAVLRVEHALTAALAQLELLIRMRRG